MSERQFAHLIPMVCVALQIAVFCIEVSHWRPIERWWYVDMASTLVALVGSIYAAVKASRWWFALTVVEALMVLVLVLALGG